MYSITMLLLRILLLVHWQLLLMSLLLQSCSAMLRCVALPSCMQLRTAKALLLLLLLRLASRNTFHVCCLTPASLCTSLSCSSCCCCSKISLSHISCCSTAAAALRCILHGRICLSFSLFTCKAATCPAGTPSRADRTPTTVCCLL
jgi:hypothetical protein